MHSLVSLAYLCFFLSCLVLVELYYIIIDI